MPSSFEDHWINEQAVTADLGQLEDTATAVDASYYLQLFLDNPPYHEPLLPALGGLTGIQSHIEHDLDSWAANKTTPFFVFNGQSIEGEDDVSVQRGKRAITGTDEAWTLYFQSQANEAVSAFGSHRGAYPIHHLFPLLQGILKRRGLHFLVPPFNASAQLAYFDLIDSDQCSAIMGSQELLLYPIKDYVIRFIDWDNNNFSAISKKSIIRTLGVTEPLFIDALLMAGTTFLSTFPPLKEPQITARQPPSVQDAVNMLRTSEKSVANACNSFNDILSKSRDPNWLQKYRKARMTIDHFVYIDESGEIKVHNFDTLTQDNWEYLGYQLPAELFHYLNTGLIGARMLSWISHGQIVIYPTLDGVKSDEYRRLVATQLMPLREAALSLLLPRLHRGIQYKPIGVKVWYDEKYSHKIEYRPQENQTSARVHTWNLDSAVAQKFYPNAKHGSIFYEVTALKNPEFAKRTIAKDKVKGIASADLISSITIWRFLHLRGYVDDKHQLTPWGEALATSLEALEPTVTKNNEVPGLFEAILLAYELLRFDLLNTRNQHPELNGLPMNGSEDDKASLLLISRCSILLKLRHQANGYTGPLSKNFLCFRSLSSSIREAGRDLIEAIVASMFLFAQTDRERSDYLEIGQKLPFLNDTDVALGIAIKTLLDDIHPQESEVERNKKKASFPGTFVPYATHFFEDMGIAFDFFDAIHAGVKTLKTSNDISVDKDAWEKAAAYLKLRR
ncbi:temperature dependent protein affecting M2 dsRNA replication-domain-containing protein [Hypoxylon trugodes]|uniref:temperature dependent protein affecting M2 dsRNA replication-domain-containing protein n=1 Tax=Hypoxylon trugodes TaxID=326681 RepID=UPI00219D93B9|nr:temperature dependent protein affecting M2 dsRNA replication-domain-containing protein [Hypoxylon trugodes]KAI1390972.1 temperature dependent protein affecting M2 dsRNA replication-domain-containing protein [Hypoxylon trugodes]